MSNRINIIIRSEADIELMNIVNNVDTTNLNTNIPTIIPTNINSRKNKPIRMSTTESPFFILDII